MEQPKDQQHSQKTVQENRNFIVNRLNVLHLVHTVHLLMNTIDCKSEHIPRDPTHHQGTEMHS